VLLGISAADLIKDNLAMPSVYSATGFRIRADELRAIVAGIFVACDLPTVAAAIVAQALVDADMRGIPSHGVLLVPMYVERLRSGSVSRHTQAEVVADHGAICVLDARHALGILTGDQAMGIAVDRAASEGVSLVVVRRAFHFGAAFRYVRRACAAGSIGIALANTRPLMPAPGGATPVVGNNPVAIGVPHGEGEPIILDMALSEAALGKIRLAASEGRSIPDTWATDADGRPTRDPEEAISGLLLPAAGPKGFGLAFMVDVLTGVLAGGGFGASVRGLYADTSAPNDCAHAFVAIHPPAFGDGEQFGESVARLAEQVVNSRTAPGVERVFLPGQIESDRHAAAAQHGVSVSPSLWQALEKTAVDVGVALPDLEPGPP
jgi:LDH2 family malate/lactate/ureidoglycolate dehydrogenase